MATSDPIPSREKLVLDDLRDVLSELNSVKEKWYNLGLELKVPVEKLCKIESEYKSDPGTCLRLMLTAWLELGNASWMSLCEALRKPIVLGEGAGLVKALMKKHCQDNDGTGSKTKKRKLSEGSSGKATKKSKMINTSDSEDKSESEKVVKTVPQYFHQEDFVTQKDDRPCSNCKMVPYSPLRLLCCDRCYCDVCSSQITECVKCGQRARFEKHQQLFKRIQKAKIKCLNRTRGCGWTGLLYQLKTHFPECIAIKDGQKETPSPPEQEMETTTGQCSKASAATTEKMVESMDCQSSTPKRKAKRPAAGKVENTPPLNIVMPNVSSHITTGKFWHSDAFLSHQLGYKLCLAVKLGQGSREDRIKVELAVKSSAEEPSAHLDYPSKGNFTVIIMNPEANEHHKVVESSFSIKHKDPTMFTEQREISLQFIRKDCLFFRVYKIEMEERDHKLWLLDPAIPLKLTQ